ncbi:MAG: stage II sporulation protein R, partial [Clostridia bacterium]|nr:stage II sporulation protein R [Clostridia bacterium]
MLLAAIPARAASLNDVSVSQYIRLHVVAADDGAAAQALKLEVRDAVLAAVRPLVADCGGAEEAWRRIGQSVDALEAA